LKFQAGLILPKIIIYSVFCGLFLLSSESNAQTVYGGHASCGTILSEAEDYETGAVHMTYTMGLISGLNLATGVTWSNAPDPVGIWKALLLHCENNPLDSHREAITSIYKQISQRQ
jgi:hypothetical protein